MVDLALRLKIFIASPNDVLEERDIAEEVIDKLKDQSARQRLLLHSFRWERQPHGYGRPQTTLNRELRSAELTIVILWSKLGSVTNGSSETGSQEELRIAGELVSKGRSDDVFVYFRNPRSHPPDGDSAELERVNQFRKGLEKSNNLLFSEYEDPPAFRERLLEDLRQWLERWQGVPSICEYAVRRALPSAVPTEYLSDSRIDDVSRVFDFQRDNGKSLFLANIAVRLYQLHGISPSSLKVPSWPWLGDDEYEADNLHDAGLTTVAGQSVPAKPLVRNGTGVSFSHPEWLFLFCAIGLVPAILQGDLGAVSRRPYVNPVHQYFKYFSGKDKIKIADVLRRWLVNADDATTGKPIARNFSAYVLGMIGAIEAQDDLAQAIRDDPGRDVKLYAIASVGRLRARPQLPILVDVFNQSAPNDSEIRDMAAQAVCRMIGFLNYEM